jgi:hypothetical protein
MKQETLKWVKDAYKTEAECITQMLDYFDKEAFSVSSLSISSLSVKFLISAVFILFTRFQIQNRNLFLQQILL